MTVDTIRPDHPARSEAVTLGALGCGMAVPLLYYGFQAIAAPFFPGFSLVSTTASELGSDLSRNPQVFNGGILLLGMFSLIASLGFLRALIRLGIPPLLRILTFLAVAMNGAQSLWAGAYPMPDPRHGGHPTFILAMLLLPPLLTASLWRLADRRLKTYFIATLLLLIAMVPLMSGMSGLDTHAYRGLLQRVFTLSIFPPIGISAYVLARRLKGLRE